MSEANTPNQVVNIYQIIVKDLSFEALIPMYKIENEFNPSITEHIDIAVTMLADDHHEVALKKQITATNDDKPIFIVEAEQVGLFKLSGFDEQALEHLHHVYCPNIIYPYLRETIANAVLRGGYPALHLARYDFEYHYAMSKQKEDQDSK